MYQLTEFLRSAGYSTFSGQGDVRLFIADLIRTALSGVAVIFFIMIIYSGYLWLTAGGNEEQVKKAQQFLKRALIGFIVTLMALIITTFVVGFVGESINPPPGGALPAERLF